MSLTGVQDRSAAAVAKTGLAAFIKRHPLVAYFAIAFAGTWLLFVPILLSGRGLGLINLPDAAGLILFVLATYAGPFLAAFITTRVSEGQPGVRAWFRRMFQWRVGIQWYLLVLIGYPLVFGVPAMLTLGEEAGWRGFALPRLQQSYGPLGGTLILAVLHALWHLPAYFVNGAIITGGFNPTVFGANSLAIIASTFVWTWLFNNTAGSILFATYMHAISNAMSGALPAALNITAPDPWFAFEVMAAAAIVVIVLTRGRLGYSRPASTS